jgi:glycosyltransferase involved in cell wall biosynthesis
MAAPIDVRILTPFGAQSGMGNWRTASRYAELLRSADIQAKIFEPSAIARASMASPSPKVAIVLNAFRCSEQVRAFVKTKIPVLLVITGTDLYGALAPQKKGSHAYQQAEQALLSASAIMTLQAEAQKEIAQRWPQLARDTHCILQTTAPRKPSAPVLSPKSKTVRFLIAGHIRGEKDPKTAFKAFHLAFPEGWALRADGRKVPVRLIHVGGTQDTALAQELALCAGRYPGVRLEGVLSHAQTMRQMTQVHALLQPSVSEGGALVVAEAVACRLPIIASDIPAHRGQLGGTYPGLFPVGNARALANALLRFVAEEGFLKTLLHAVEALTPSLANPEHERDELVRLVRLVATKPQEKPA